MDLIFVTYRCLTASESAQHKDIRRIPAGDHVKNKQADENSKEARPKQERKA